MAAPCDIVETAASATGSSPSSVLIPGLPLADAGALTEAVLQGFLNLSTDAGAIIETVTDARVGLLTDSAQVVDSVIQTAANASLVVESALARAVLFSLHADTASASGAFTDAALQAGFLDRVREQAALTDSVTATLVAVELVKASMTGQAALLRLVYEKLATAQGDASAVVIGYIEAGTLVEDSASATALAIEIAALRDLVTEAAAVAVTIIDKLTALELVQDDAWGMDAALAEANGVAWWTAPTDTLAMSRYRMPAFESIDVVAGELVAVGMTGSYLRAGETDDGAAIDASVTTGLHDFGSEFLKRVDHLYAGYVSPNGVTVEVGETSTGAELTYSYAMPARAASAPTQGKIRLGRGLRSLYYRFTLRNSAGKPLTVTTANVDVEDTGRKV